MAYRLVTEDESGKLKMTMPPALVKKGDKLSLNIHESRKQGRVVFDRVTP